MLWNRLRTIRVQLVLLYLSVLAVLLLALGIFQTFTLREYLRSTTADGMRHAAYAELHILGPCFIQTPGDLNRNAQSLAQLLGSHETAVKIVTPSGQTLADHGFGSPGQSQALQLSAGTIQQLIQSTRLSGGPAAPVSSTSSCESTAPSQTTHQHRTPVSGSQGTLNEGNLMLSAIPLGPSGHSVGYALLGRSFADANATIQRNEIVFALGAIAALLLGAIAAFPLINRALRPLRSVADAAGAIAAGNLQRRANLSHSPDEIGRLGSSFDTMVDRLQSALNAANASEERMRRFLADASHELRTPLTVLRGTSEVLLRQGSRESPELVGALRAMHEESVRLSKLVDDLLTLTRLDEGQPLSPEVVRIRPFLEQFTERYAGAWPNRRIDLALGPIDGEAAYVDPDALRRVVTNLVDNAARYSTAGEPITVTGGVANGTVTVSVHDEGPGFSRDDMERVFERFYRGNKSRSRDSGGTGLGLAIVQALVQQSGGEVHIDSGSNRGTTISFTLPRPDPSPDSL